MSVSEARHMQTRSSARVFGANITNYSLEQLSEFKRGKPRRRPSLSTHCLRIQPEVSPYAAEISSHTRSQEHQAFIGDDFMAWHSDISASMREVLVGWLVEIQPQLGLGQHSLFLAALIVDKYCHSRYVSKHKYQLLGLAALFVAAKFEEVRTPRLKAYFNIAGGQYSYEQILAMESDILLALDFQVTAVTSCWLLDEHLQSAGLEGDDRALCQFLLELALVEYGFCLVRPSLLSWAVVLYVGKLRGAGLCELEIAESSGLEVGELKEAFGSVALLFMNRRAGKFRSVARKYACLQSLIA